ncbi:Hsp70 family protein [Dactylosporangium fulvum]|uniref:Hsp70 family protein n=1 Tax=Dactylosporangium fulvum TaxID=53359 RepID=A0ABY5VR25_9ACTN|nr:Hsp70 family protein [Dactylosporangium fulvum]UWP79244.1 Hsp70 family protein [Dactylosporangium fulvum]
MIGGGFRLGVDFGTSTTVAVLAWPDGRTRPLTFDGSPLLPSAVYAEPDGQLLTGRDARHWARRHPECFEPHPKRRVDDGTVLLGEREVGVVELFGAVLSRVAAEAVRVAGGPPAEVTVTCPVSWGPRRRELLVRAAVAAGLPRPALVDEPVAAAAYFVTVLGATLPAGSHLVVYDLGAGTFDATVVARTEQGFTVVTSTGLADRGGLDIDAAVVEHLRGVYADRADAWQRLAEPAHRDAWLDLQEHVHDGKAMLSRSASTFVRLPLLDVDAPLGREELDEVARPVLDETVTAMAAALRAVPGPPTAVFLVGGASRMPLVSTVVHRSTGVAPVVIEQPELVVAEGALHAPVPVRPGEAPAPPLTPAPQPDSRTAPPATAPTPAAAPAPARRVARLMRRDYVRPALLLLAMALAVLVGPVLVSTAGLAALGTGARAPLVPAGYLAALALTAALAAGGAARSASSLFPLPHTTGPPRAGHLLGLAATATAGLLAVVTGAALLSWWSGGGAIVGDRFVYVVPGVDRWLSLAALAAGLAIVVVGLRGLATRRPVDVFGLGAPARYATALVAGAALGTATLSHRFGVHAADAAPIPLNGDRTAIGVAANHLTDDPVLYVAHQVFEAGGWAKGVPLWTAVALGAFVLLAGLMFAGTALRTLVAWCRPRWRQFLSGSAYGLCLTAGAYLAYHAVADVRTSHGWRDASGALVVPPRNPDLVITAGTFVWWLGWWPLVALIAAAALAGIVLSVRRRAR